MACLVVVFNKACLLVVFHKACLTVPKKVRLIVGVPLAFDSIIIRRLSRHL